MAVELTCPRCQTTRCKRFGRSSGHQRFRSRGCGRTWTESAGTPLFHLHTPLPEIVRAIRIALRRCAKYRLPEPRHHAHNTAGAKG